MSSDIREQHDLSGELPDEARRLKGLLWRYFERYQAQLPVRRAGSAK